MAGQVKLYLKAISEFLSFIDNYISMLLLKLVNSIIQTIFIPKFVVFCVITLGDNIT